MGEALGYRGGHFTGIAMTSERILLKGNMAPLGAKFFQRLSPDAPVSQRKTSSTSILSRRHLSCVARCSGLGIAADQFVLWNAFPWHSFDARAGMLSNRIPTKAELAAGTPTLTGLHRSFPGLYDS